MSERRTLRLAVCTALWIAALPPVAAQAPLPAATRELLRATDISANEIAAIAVRLDDDAVVLAHDPDRAMQPASTLKTLTAIVALERLGPAWRARTTALATAGILHGRLDGDLFLKGGGSVDFDADALRQMLRELRFAGIRRITGDVVLDRTLFRPARSDIGVPPFDETPEFRYNVIPDALLLNTNLVRLDLAADNARIRALVTPPLDRVEISTRALALVDRPCDKWEDGWQLPVVQRRARGVLRIGLRGEFPANCTADTAVDVLDRVTFVDRLFRATWRALGGRFDGVVRDGETPAAARTLAEHRSRTLLEWTREILKRSDNPTARQVYLVLGAQVQDAATTTTTTAAASERVVRDWLRAHGLDDAGLVLDNGSGLSRRERIRPRLLAAVLAAAAKSRFAPEFQAMLPIVGVDAGMEKRLRDSPAARGGRIKTGSLRNVIAVAGYIPDASGRMCAVVAIINHDAPFDTWATQGRAALDSVLDSVARIANP